MKGANTGGHVTNVKGRMRRVIKDQGRPQDEEKCKDKRCFSPINYNNAHNAAAEADDENLRGINSVEEWKWAHSLWGRVPDDA